MIATDSLREPEDDEHGPLLALELTLRPEEAASVERGRPVPLPPARRRCRTSTTQPAWGEHDAVGGADVAQATAELIPDARLEPLRAGHGPRLGHSDRIAELIAGSVR